MAVIIAGEIESSEVIEVLEKFEEKILTKVRIEVERFKIKSLSFHKYFFKNPETWKMDERPFSKPIEPLATSSFETVNFPCDNEKTSNGIASIGWRGPHINSVEELISLDLIFTYLTDSSVSTLQSHFIQKNSLCNRVNIPETFYISISCIFFIKKHNFFTCR